MDIQNLQHSLEGLLVPDLSVNKVCKCEYKSRPFAPTEEAKHVYYTCMEPQKRRNFQKESGKEQSTEQEKEVKKAKIDAANMNK